MTQRHDPVLVFLSDAAEQPTLRELVSREHRRAPYVMDVEDLLQDVVLRALISKARFAGQTRGELRAWLQTIARRALIDRLRQKLGRPVTRSLGASANDLPSQSGGTQSDDEWLARAMQRLSPLETALLRARYETGLSFEQIGRIINHTPESARQIHRRALKALRSWAERSSE